MEPLLIRLAPDLPVCWETVTTLRFGFDRAVARLEHPSAAAQRFVSLLREGVPVDRAATASQRAGLSAFERHRLLDALAPALRYDPPHPAPEDHRSESPGLRVAVVGSGRLARDIASHLSRCGHAVSSSERAETLPEGGVEFAVLVERYLSPAERAQPFLTNGIPHLPVRVTDRSLVIGPLVLPGETACLGCVELHGREAEPNAAVLAAQLVRVPPAAETASSCRFAAGLVGTAIAQWRAGDAELASGRLRYPVAEGVPSLLPSADSVGPHPECACALFSAGGPAGGR